MPVFTEALTREVRLEYMRPEMIEEARRQMSAMYVPCGSIEWHGYHNVVGLDTLKAHEQLVGLAQQVGGVVYPPIYFGAGGGHGAWPSTFMVSAAPMTTIVNELLRGFEANGYRAAILLSGHYPNRNQYLDAAVHAYHEAGGRMRVLAIIENQVPGVAGDHAAKYETSSMLHLHPETVDLARLHTDASGAPTPDDQPHNWMDEAYRGHPCYGLVGFDPRGAASAEIGRANTATLIAFLTEWLAAG